MPAPPLPLGAVPLDRPPDVPLELPERCASATVEPAASASMVSAMVTFMDPPLLLVWSVNGRIRGPFLRLARFGCTEDSVRPGPAPRVGEIVRVRQALARRRLGLGNLVGNALPLA